MPFNTIKVFLLEKKDKMHRFLIFIAAIKNNPSNFTVCKEQEGAANIFSI